MIKRSSPYRSLAQLVERVAESEEALSHEATVANLVDSGYVHGAVIDLIEQLRQEYSYEIDEEPRLTDGS